MKTLKVPHIPALDSMDLLSAGLLMESNACREYIDTVNWKEFPYKPVAVVDIARSDSSLYLRYSVKCLSLKALYDKDGSPVHTDSCVEFFMRKADAMNYMNFEFNCIGTCHSARRESRNKGAMLQSEEYASIRRHSTLGKDTFSEKEGIHAWELIVCIPFNLMGLDPANLPEKIMGNFYKCADDTKYPHFVSWNPIGTERPDFHRPEYFGEICF